MDEKTGENPHKEKLKLWLKEPENLFFIGILIFAIAFRLYYFFLTKSQPLWWDEADYMAYAKHLAGVENGWQITPQHSSLFPFIAAAFIKIGFSEEMIRLFLSVLPSILVIYLTYKVCLLMYHNKKIALISMFLMAVFWEFLFNSFRFHIENLALVFIFLAIYSFWKGYEHKQKIFKIIGSNWAVPLTAIFLVLAYAIRRSFVLFIPAFGIYLLLSRPIKPLLKDKYNWVAAIVFIILLIIVELFVFSSPVTDVAETYYKKDTPFSLLPLQIFDIYFVSESNYWLSSLYFLFLAGAVLLVFNLIFSFGYFKQQEGASKLKSDLFVVLAIIITLGWFLFIQRREAGNIGDPRWYYPLLLGSIVCISRAAVTITDQIKKHSRLISITFLILIIGYGGYYEMQHAGAIIDGKIPTYEGVKQASLFLKDISQPTDTIFSVPNSQPSYYAERKVVTPQQFTGSESNMQTTFEQFMAELKKPENSNVKYLLVSFSEPGHPPWMLTPSQQSIQIPFLDTTLDMSGANQHVIKESKSYGNIEFKLLTIKEDTFVYEIIRA